MRLVSIPPAKPYVESNAKLFGAVCNCVTVPLGSNSGSFSQRSSLLGLNLAF